MTNERKLSEQSSWTPDEWADEIYAAASHYDDEFLYRVSGLFRAQAEALKIATGNRGEFESGDHMAFDKLMCASTALARIKEV